MMKSRPLHALCQKRISLGIKVHAPTLRGHCITMIVRSNTTDTNTSEPSLEKPFPEGLLMYSKPSGGDRFWTWLKLMFALPWRRFKKDSVLVFKLDGQISDQSRGRFDNGLSLPAICSALEKAVLDPRIKGKYGCGC